MGEGIQTAKSIGAQLPLLGVVGDDEVNVHGFKQDAIPLCYFTELIEIATNGRPI